MGVAAKARRVIYDIGKVIDWHPGVKRPFDRSLVDAQPAVGSVTAVGDLLHGPRGRLAVDAGIIRFCG